MKPILLTIVSCFCLIITMQAQDLMYLKNVKEPIKVKVVEIGLDEIKYKPWGDTAIPVLVLPRLNVAKLVLANGSVFEFKDNPMTDAANYSDQHNSAIKFGFLSPIYSHSAFSFEHSLKPGRSYEIGVGIIGAGVQYSNWDVKGLFVRAGYKFMTSPDFYVRGMRYSHILKGGYIKPEIVFGNYGINRYDYFYSYYGNSTTGLRRNVVCGAILINMGKQWVIDDVFLFDLHFGFGYGTSNYSSYSSGYGYPYDYETPEYYHYAFFGGWDSFPIALSGGFKMGFLFGKQNTETRKTTP